jgi:hypothetical protein
MAVNSTTRAVRTERRLLITGVTDHGMSDGSLRLAYKYSGTIVTG